MPRNSYLYSSIFGLYDLLNGDSVCVCVLSQTAWIFVATDFISQSFAQLLHLYPGEGGGILWPISYRDAPPKVQTPYPLPILFLFIEASMFCLPQGCQPPFVVSFEIVMMSAILFSLSNFRTPQKIENQEIQGYIRENITVWTLEKQCNFQFHIYPRDLTLKSWDLEIWPKTWSLPDYLGGLTAL